MCFAIIVATFAAGEIPQTIKVETELEFENKMYVLRENDHCTAISVYKRDTKYVRVPVWQQVANSTVAGFDTASEDTKNK